MANLLYYDVAVWVGRLYGFCLEVIFIREKFKKVTGDFKKIKVGGVLEKKVLPRGLPRFWEILDSPDQK